MKQSERLRHYYLYTLGPILLILCLIFFSFGQLGAVFFALGYFWPLLYYAPGFEQRATSSAYRYSFLGNFFRLQQKVFFLVGENASFWKRSLSRLFLPLCFSLVLILVAPSWHPLWTILGWLFFEGIFILDKKFQWALFKEEDIS